MVRAKFVVYERTRTEFFNCEPAFTIKARAVTSGSEENKSFWKYTPSGELVMQTVNPEAAEQFKPGKEFYLDFTPAE